MGGEFLRYIIMVPRPSIGNVDTPSASFTIFIDAYGGHGLMSMNEDLELHIWEKPQSQVRMYYIMRWEIDV